jgi:predicted RNA binding protein YcfA (HicA-like mRNA interferase family)
MKLPRDVSGEALIKALGKLGYRVTRQAGSHVRLTADTPAQHHIAVPNHDPLKIGTLAAIPGDVAAHAKLSREEVIERLFGTLK